MCPFIPSILSLHPTSSMFVIREHWAELFVLFSSFLLAICYILHKVMYTNQCYSSLIWSHLSFPPTPLSNLQPSIPMSRILVLKKKNRLGGNGVDRRRESLSSHISGVLLGHGPRSWTIGRGAACPRGLWNVSACSDLSLSSSLNLYPSI